MLKEVTINSVKFTKGSWFLIRPNEDDLNKLPAGSHPPFGVPKKMWFGKVLEVFSHTGPTETSTLFHVEWHKTLPAPQGPYDVHIQAPVVQAAPAQECCWFGCRGVLPLVMTAVQHPTRANAYLMMRPSWHELAAVNMPVPWPKLHYTQGEGQGDRQ